MMFDGDAEPQWGARMPGHNGLAISLAMLQQRAFPRGRSNNNTNNNSPGGGGECDNGLRDGVS